MIKKRSDLNGKVYGRQNRQMLMPKEESSQHEPYTKSRLVFSSNPEINKRTFRRSPHLQAVMDRIEERRKLDREKEIRWQAFSRRRKNRKPNVCGKNRWDGDDAERDQSDILEMFAKYDNMLEHLVLRNMELVSLADKKKKEASDNETVLTEKVLKDLRSLRQFRDQQQQCEPFHLSELKEMHDLPSLQAARNPYLNFNRPNELQDDKDTSGAQTKSIPMSSSPTSSSRSRKQFVIGDEEIIDTFRPPAKSLATTVSIPAPKDRLEEDLSRVTRIRELRERRRKRKETRAQRLERAVNKTNKRKVREDLRRKVESHEGNYKSKEEQLPEPRQQLNPSKSQSVENRKSTTKPLDLLGAGQSLGKAHTLRKELEEMWCICPLELPPESHPQPPRNTRLVETEVDPQTDESDNESFGPSKEARKLKKRLSTIYQQSKSLRIAQEDMRGEMQQLQKGYKQKYNKLKRKFLRNTALPKQHQNETPESEHFITTSELRGPEHPCYQNGERGDSINYEVRDGVIVLDDIYGEDIDTPEREFLGVHNPQYMPDLSGANSYVKGPNMLVPDEMHGYDQDFVHQAVMELPFSPEEQAQYLNGEWNYVSPGVGVSQLHSQNHYIRREGNYTDDEDSLSRDTQSAYTVEHYQTRREPAWNCATDL